MVVAEWHAVRDYDDVPEGLTPVDVAGEMVLLVRIGEAIHACSATCPHKFTALSDGTLAPGRLTCPMHAATFDLSSGRPFPGQEWAGNLPIYPLRVRDGVVEVQV
ncbi:MAG: 3-phenylpropionate/trans-cinnamate dioxygenase ferredoxin component [Thermoplasmata archaeon]|nr:3-phenylpropionate/trans-cinnamate dioxygenase ferredoxin component [Thermoplasmata archaeon]